MLIQKLLTVAQVGSTAVLYVLMFLSVLSIAAVVERWWFFRRRKLDPAAIGRQLVEQLRAGRLQSAREILKQSRAIEAEVLDEALEWYPDSPEAVSEILQSAIRKRNKALQAGLLFLGTLGNNAPFIGLFGTVLGIVTAFRELAGANASAMGNVMSGIAEALVATALGILVALPAVIAYNVFQKKANEVEENVAAIGGQVLAVMKRQPEQMAHRNPNGNPEEIAAEESESSRREVEA